MSLIKFNLGPKINPKKQDDGKQTFEKRNQKMALLNFK